MSDFDPTLVQRRSKLLFGQVHRLALMIAIARSDGRVNPTDLARELGVAQSAFQVPLRDLEEAGLLDRTTGERRQVYVRQKSLAWEWALELEAELKRQSRVTPIKKTS